MLHVIQQHRQNRHSSIFDLDSHMISPVPNSSSPVSSSASSESLQSTSSTERRDRRFSHLRDQAGRRESYNARIFKGMRIAGELPNADDIQQTRREARDAFADATTREERRRSIEDALCTIEELENCLPMKAKTDAETNFIYELSALIGWAYSTMRFCGFVPELPEHFKELKDHFRRLLPALPALNEYRFLATLRFSALCLEYAEMCDEEAINWCRDALRDLAGSIRSMKAELSRMTDAFTLSRDIRRLEDVADRLHHNIEQVQFVWTVRLPHEMPIPEKLV